MNALAQKIARLIRMDGPISVAQLMTMALHDRAHGYYATHHPIGAAGDFITAPEISQMFGELLGLWCVQSWRDQRSPSPARLVELGPGCGTLIADALRAARVDGEFHSNIEVVLIEASERLQQVQRAKLSHSLSPSGGDAWGEGAPTRIRWANTFDDSLIDRPLFLLANEFFDALPIRQFVFTERGWCERMVGIGENDELQFALSPLPIPLNVPHERGAPRVGDIYETCSSGDAIVEQAAATIAQHGGTALIVDYGYTKARFGETFQAVSQHKYASVLESPGEADLSAHVDFAALARAAERGGAKAYGPIDQGALLQSLGIAARAERLMQHNPDQGTEIAAAVERLVSPQQMGTLFKVLAIVPKHVPAPPGFSTMERC